MERILFYIIKLIYYAQNFVTVALTVPVPRHPAALLLVPAFFFPDQSGRSRPHHLVSPRGPPAPPVFSDNRPLLSLAPRHGLAREQSKKAWVRTMGSLNDQLLYYGDVKKQPPAKACPDQSQGVRPSAVSHGQGTLEILSIHSRKISPTTVERESRGETKTGKSQALMTLAR